MGTVDGAMAFCKTFDVANLRGGSADTSNADGKLRFPANLSVQPSQDPDAAKTVRVTLLGYDDTTDPGPEPCRPDVIPASVIRTDTVLKYVKDQFLEVPMPFTLSCAYNECGGMETCRAGECVPLRENDRNYRKLAEGLVSATACYATDACTAPTRLEPMDGCRFALPSGRRPEELAPFATYDFGDGRLAGIEFLTKDVVSTSGSVLTLEGDLCTKFANGFVRTVSVARCTAFDGQPFCPANAEKAAEYAAATDPERFDRAMSPDGGLGSDGGASRDSGSDATVADAGPDGSRADGAATDGSAIDGGSGDGGGTTCETTCCGRCDRGVCTDTTVGDVVLTGGAPLLTTVEPDADTHSTAFWVTANGLELWKLEAGVDAAPVRVRTSGIPIRQLTRAGRYVVYAVPGVVMNGPTVLEFVDADDPFAMISPLTLQDGVLDGRMLANASYLYLFDENTGTGNMTVTRRTIPRRGGVLPDASRDLGFSPSTGALQFAAVTDSGHVLVSARFMMGNANDVLKDVDFSASVPRILDTAPVSSAFTPNVDLGLGVYASVPFRFLGPSSAPVVVRYSLDGTTGFFEEPALGGGLLLSGGPSAGATEIGHVRASTPKPVQGEVGVVGRVVYVKNPSTASPEIFALDARPGTESRIQVGPTLASRVVDLAVTRDCAFVARELSATQHRIEGYPIP
ncbi:MAG: hypothetical protein U0169_10860 [Polyangiaceae bacterium]